MLGIDNKIFLKTFRSEFQAVALITLENYNKCQKLIKQNDIFLENASFCSCCRLIAATIRPA